MALATLSELKKQLGFKDSDSQYDTKLTLYLNAASTWVESYCNRIFESATYTELFHGNASNCLNTRQWPITAVTELRISSDRAWTDASTLVDTDDYGIDQDGFGVLLFSRYFPNGFNNVRMIYTAGYVTIPADLQLACIWAGEWFYLHNSRGDSGRTGTSKQGENVTILADVPPMIKSILAPYKRWELPSSGLAVSHI